MPFEIIKLNESWYTEIDWENSGIEIRRIPLGRNINICACDAVNRILVFSLVSNCYESKDQEYFCCLVIHDKAFEFKEMGDPSALFHARRDFELLEKGNHDSKLYSKYDAYGLLTEGYNLMRDYYRSK